MMICCTCRKKIEHGDFRYRSTEAGFVTQHRNCSIDDPAWARRDRDARRLAAFHERRRTAFSEFVAKWGDPSDLMEIR